VQARLADAALAVDGLTLLAWAAATDEDGGLRTAELLWAGAACGGMTASAHQVHGAVGFAVETGLHRLYRRARALQTWAAAACAAARCRLSPSIEGLHAPGTGVASVGSGVAHLGRGAAVTTEPVRAVRIEILARKDCPSRGMAAVVVERVIAETGAPVHLEVVDITTQAEATERRFLGSPTVRVDGLDVEPGSNGCTDFTLADRVYRGDRGLQGWPDERWIREALLLAIAQSTPNGDSSSSSSSATSP
jgi:hypothetical protein